MTFSIDDRVHFELHIRQGSVVNFDEIRNRLPDLDRDEIRASLVRLVDEGRAFRTIDPQHDRHCYFDESTPPLEMTSVTESWFDTTACDRCGMCCSKDTVVPLVESDRVPEELVDDTYVSPRTGERGRAMKRGERYCAAYDESLPGCSLHGSVHMPWNCVCFAAGIHSEQCNSFKRIFMGGGHAARLAAREKLDDERYERLNGEGSAEKRKKLMPIRRLGRLGGIMEERKVDSDPPRASLAKKL